MKNWKTFIPLLLSLLLIFGLTVQDCRKSADLTVTTQTVIAHVANTNQGGHWWDDYKLMRRLAHIPEYLLLGMSSMYALRRWWKAVILCIGISFIDEIVKGILPGREFDFIDMRFDLMGYAVGILIMVVILKIYSLRRS